MADTGRLEERDFAAAQREDYAKSGVAMPDGSFPIPDEDALRRAIKAIGRAKPDKRDAVRAHIRKRAKALGVSLEGSSLQEGLAGLVRGRGGRYDEKLHPRNRRTGEWKDKLGVNWEASRVAYRAELDRDVADPGRVERAAARERRASAGERRPSRTTDSSKRTAAQSGSGGPDPSGRRSLRARGPGGDAYGGRDTPRPSSGWERIEGPVQVGDELQVRALGGPVWKVTAVGPDGRVTVRNDDLDEESSHDAETIRAGFHRRTGAAPDASAAWRETEIVRLRSQLAMTQERARSSASSAESKADARKRAGNIRARIEALEAGKGSEGDGWSPRTTPRYMPGLREATDSRSLPDIPKTAAVDNWVEKAGHMPPFIVRIAKHLFADGKPKDKAWQMAVGIAQRVCATGKSGGSGQWNAGSKAEACKAVGQWEALKAKSKAGKLSEAECEVFALVEAAPRERLPSVEECYAILAEAGLLAERLTRPH